MWIWGRILLISGDNKNNTLQLLNKHGHQQFSGSGCRTGKFSPDEEFSDHGNHCGPLSQTVGNGIPRLTRRNQTEGQTDTPNQTAQPAANMIP